jgi:hypothetical protein
MLESLVSLFTKKRVMQIARFKQHPHEVQKEVLAHLVQQASQTEWGQRHGYSGISSPRAYRQQVPVSEYDDLAPFIKRMMQGEPNILWPSLIKWFAKSSGTTSGRSKFIPVFREALEDCHFRGGKGLITFYLAQHPDSRLYRGKAMQ